MAPKKAQTPGRAGPSTSPPRSSSPDIDNLQQQITQLVTLNQEQQNRQQTFEDRVMALFERLTSTNSTPIPTPLRTPNPNPEPIDENTRNTQHTIDFSKAFSTIPTVDKLKGRSNYKTWTINIERVAKGCDVWSAFTAPNPSSLSTYKQDFALSIIIINVVPSIQSTLSEHATAYNAWEALKKQYNTQTISNVSGILRTLHVLNYDSFETIETFQQRFTSLTQQITDFAKTDKDALQAIYAGLLLNAIGRADLSVQASLENNINSKLVPDGQSSTQYIFHTLSSYKRMIKDRDRSTANAVQSIQCTHCDRQHKGLCYVQYPDRAPEHLRSMYQHLHEQHSKDRSRITDIVASRTASAIEHSPTKRLE